MLEYLSDTSEGWSDNVKVGAAEAVIETLTVRGAFVFGAIAP